jgi:hypothetical protein
MRELSSSSFVLVLVLDKLLPRVSRIRGPSFSRDAVLGVPDLLLSGHGADAYLTETHT